MNIPSGIGAVLAIIVLVVAVLALIGLGLPAQAIWIRVALLAIARLT